MKKIFYIIFSCIILLFILWLGAEYMMFCRKPAEPQIPDTAVLSSENTVPIGEQLFCSVSFSLPYAGKCRDISVNPGKHAAASGSPEISTVKYGLFSAEKKITVALRTISPGTENDAGLSFQTTIGGKTFSHTVKIPEFKTAEPAEQNIEVLQLASPEKIVPESRLLRNVLAVAGVLAAAAALLTILYLTKFRKKHTALSDWEKTRQELSRLKSDITESRITPENGFIRLTDLVRSYLEKRFGLPATRRTTPEFIEDISRNGDFVPDDRKPFLRNFLEAADQVKFAMAHPEKELLNKALVNAESLIDATRPPEEEKNV